MAAPLTRCVHRLLSNSSNSSSRASRRWCSRRQAGRVCKLVGKHLWEKLPRKWQDGLQPRLSQLMFYWICVRWALRWIWEDRHMMLRELRGLLFHDMWAAEGPPPMQADKVVNELRPFGYALVVGLAYTWFALLQRFAWGSGPSPDLTLDG
mmetsp:Transcript_42098/g.97460  ORF Transcript_42098/g.97460 Transcript_42098/m.97460 type:complete len:151 (-) Transcript_42098:10-462(-)